MIIKSREPASRSDIKLSKIALGAWAWGNDSALGSGIDAIRFWEKVMD